MRLALLLSGQPRGLPLSFEMLKKAIIEPNEKDFNIDVFFHAWHDELKVGQPYNSAQPLQNNRVGFIKAGTEKFLVDNLNPKKYVVEPQKDFPHLRNLKSEPSANQELLGSNFYSVYISNELKKQYEQENNFEYDVVLRTRYDLFYYHPIIIKNYLSNLDSIIVMEEFQNHQDWKNSSDLPMVDIFAIGNSKNMNIFCSLYPNYEKMNKEVFIPFGENLLGTWVRKTNNVTLQKAPWKFQILHRVVDLSKV